MSYNYSAQIFGDSICSNKSDSIDFQGHVHGSIYIKGLRTVFHVFIDNSYSRLDYLNDSNCSCVFVCDDTSYEVPSLQSTIQHFSNKHMSDYFS